MAILNRGISINSMHQLCERVASCLQALTSTHTPTASLDIRLRISIILLALILVSLRAASTVMALRKTGLKSEMSWKNVDLINNANAKNYRIYMYYMFTNVLGFV
jgi:hypothetical protein